MVDEKTGTITADVPTVVGEFNAHGFTRNELVLLASSLDLFAFQAEDGIRVFHVTGVQTCALPISTAARASDGARREPERSEATARERAGDRPLERRWAQLALGARSGRWGRSGGVV